MNTVENLGGIGNIGSMGGMIHIIPIHLIIPIKQDAS